MSIDTTSDLILINKVYNINDRSNDLENLNYYFTQIDYVLSDTTGLKPHCKSLIPKTCQDTEESYKTKVDLATFEPYYQEVTGKLFTKIITSDLKVAEPPELKNSQELSELLLQTNLQKTITDVLFYSRYGYTLAIIEPTETPSENEIILINPKNVMGFRPYNVKDTKDLIHLRYKLYVEDKYSDGSISNKVSLEIRQLDLVGNNMIRFRKYKPTAGSGQFNVNLEPYSDQTFEITNKKELGLPVFYFTMEDYNIDRSILLRRPPFMEVVSLNLEHYLVKAGLNYILFLSTYFKEYLFGVGRDELIKGAGGNISEVIGVTDSAGKSQWSQIEIKDLYDAFSDRLEKIKEAIDFFAFSVTAQSSTPSTVESAVSKVQDTELSADSTRQHLKSLEDFFNDLINHYISMDKANFPFKKFCTFEPKMPIVVNPQEFTQGKKDKPADLNKPNKPTVPKPE